MDWAAGDIANFSSDNDTAISFKIKEKITGQTSSKGTKIVEIMVPIKYPRNFRGTLEMPLINCEINLDLNCSKKCVIVATAVTKQSTWFSITHRKLYVPVITLAPEDNTKLLEQLKLGFKKQSNGINTYQDNQKKDKTNILII